MEKHEKLIALEHIIYKFADNQLRANDVSPAEAVLIMEAISGKMQRRCLESVIMGMVSIDQDVENQAEEHTGTVEDLKRALDKVVTEQNCAAV